MGECIAWAVDPTIDRTSHKIHNDGMGLASELPRQPTVWKVRLDSRRRPTLPEEVMKAAGLEPGAELRISVAEEGCLVIETPAHILKRAKSRIKTKGSGREVDAFLAQRVAEAAQE